MLNKRRTLANLRRHSLISQKGDKKKMVDHVTPLESTGPDQGAGASASDSERPPCACHGEPSLWHRDRRRVSGGYWRCSVKRRAAASRYDASEKRRIARARYKASDKGRAAQERYLLSDKGRATERRRILAAATRRRAARIEELEAQLTRQWDSWPEWLRAHVEPHLK